jgi:toxin ParE1/3/4
MSRFRLAPEARADLRAIGRYTLQAWGSRQRHRYAAALRKQIELIASTPGLGSLRLDLGEGVRSLSAFEHVIIYRPSDNIILRVVHRRRDPNIAGQE